MIRHRLMLMINGGEYYSTVEIVCKDLKTSWSSREEECSRKNWNQNLSGDQLFADGVFISIPCAFEYHGQVEDKNVDKAF